MREAGWPFVGTEALATGRVTRRTLRSRHQRVYRNVYLPNGQELTPVTRAVAGWLWSGRTATVASVSAAALHGSRWLDARLPAELNRAAAGGADGIIMRLGDRPGQQRPASLSAGCGASAGPCRAPGGRLHLDGTDCRVVARSAPRRVT